MRVKDRKLEGSSIMRLGESLARVPDKGTRLLGYPTARLATSSEIYKQEQMTT